MDLFGSYALLLAFALAIYAIVGESRQSSPDVRS